MYAFYDFGFMLCTGEKNALLSDENMSLPRSHFEIVVAVIHRSSMASSLRELAQVCPTTLVRCTTDNNDTAAERR